MFVNCSNIYLEYFDTLLDEVLPELKNKLTSLQYSVLVEDVIPMYRRDIKTDPLVDDFMVEKLIEEIVERYNFV